MEYYNSLAEGYDRLYGDEQKRKYRIIGDRLGILPEDTVLDVGCGTGAGEVLGCVLTGIDPSEEMVKRARFPAVTGRAEELPYPDASFDYVISVTAIHHVTDMDAALSEIRRVGRRGYAITFLKGSKKSGMLDKKIRGSFTVDCVLDDVKDRIYILRP